MLTYQAGPGLNFGLRLHLHPYFVFCLVSLLVNVISTRISSAGSFLGTNNSAYSHGPLDKSV